MSPRLLCAAPGYLAVGGMETFMSSLLSALAAGQWDIQCLATNYRGEMYNRLQSSFVCYDLSEEKLTPAKVLKAADLINDLNPDIVFMNHCALIQYTLPLLRSSIKPVSVIHSDDARFYRTAAIFRDRIFRWIAPTMTVSKEARAFVGNKNSNRIATIPHGVRTDIFYRSAGERKTTGRICFVGYVAENKGADLLLDIMKNVIKSHPHAILTVVGYGPMEATLKRAFHSAGLKDALDMRGPLLQEDVAEILRSSDMLLLPTRLEGFGLSIVEAMLCGTIPVVTKLPGVTDQLVEHEKSGFLVNKGDIAGFSDAINSLLSKKNRLHKMSIYASTKSIGLFSIERMVSDYKILFAEEDDRPMLRARTKVGWTAEVLHEYLRDGSCLNLIKKTIRAVI